ncbi:phosphoenolpyruvate--protein phosphotransferase [Treponema denticola]|uniref:phosphoenolpyruvate--protein phosphotransferase n=1 Tax=Treponema denticola TaxID=158 RepID=UPI0020A52FF7|nr:phosphoenolpyruvate--protein phosphotransferase [Treponema denticola]UTC83956.1 phosphoenolpyruvate--protein phosphotransferase [Treponema denticola]
MKKLNGLIASDGLAAGPLYCIMEQPETVIPSYSISENEIGLQKSRLAGAVEKAKNELSELISSSSDVEKTENDKTGEDIISTHILMLSDTAFLDSVFADIEKTRMNAEFVLKRKLDETVAMLQTAGDEYLSARAVDIQDAFESVFVYLLKQGARDSRFTKVPKGAIIAAKLIKPSEALLVKNAGVNGIIMEEGGVTSHISIMARAWDIPMLVGVKNCMDFARTNMPAALDADGGFVLFNPSKPIIKEYEGRIEKRNAEIKELLEAQKNYTERLSITTKDGVKVSVNANIAFPEEIENKFVTVSNGIGLFRSEFLFLEDGKIPDEDTQFEAYKKVVEAMGKKPVIIRTFDVGADKMIDEQENLREKNPLLGWRAVRYCIERKEVFKTQIKAILRAGVFGNVFLLIPMISNIEEIIEVKKIIEECKLECNAAGEKIIEKVNVGIMVEVPSTAVAADLYAPYLDFFSIGTNDLIQYTMAADRENTKVAYLANYFEPAVLRLIKNVIDAQRFIKEQVGHLVSMCGEMASHEDAAFLLLGMGLRHFSMPAGKILKMQKFMQSVNVKDAEALYEKIKKLNSASQIKTEVQKTLEKYYAEK